VRNAQPATPSLPSNATRSRRGRRAPRASHGSELGVARLACRSTPSTVLPLLLLHGEVASDRHSAGDTAGTQRALDVAVELVQMRALDDADQATRTAVAEVTAALADTFFALGTPSSTRALLERAHELDPDNLQVAIGLAAVYELAGDSWRVVATLGPFAERPQAPVELRLRLGVNLRRVGRPDHAAAVLSSCTAEGHSAWVRALATEELALLQLDRGRPAEAAALLEDGHRVLPREQGLLVLLAYVREQGGQVARARRILRQLDQLAAGSAGDSRR
jgi:Flp pilus assembly protein TadD